nr:DNA mismatch repair endonuclease MutH [Legionella jordanis]
MLQPPNPKLLKNEGDLLALCARIESLTFAQLASLLQLNIPEDNNRRKGWVGMAIELALGATAGNKAVPDFSQIGIELKTLPLNSQGKPSESTFVTSIPLLSIHTQQWTTSQCWSKLQRILWVPIEGDRNIPFHQRRIGQGFLWSPSPEQTAILEKDWEELVFMISSGRLEELNASMGTYLQVRPKAANAKSLCYGFDQEGNKILTLPRGFYLRSRFTNEILQSYK